MRCGKMFIMNFDKDKLKELKSESLNEILSDPLEEPELNLLQASVASSVKLKDKNKIVLEFDLDRIQAEELQMLKSAVKYKSELKFRIFDLDETVYIKQVSYTRVKNRVKIKIKGELT